MIELGKKEIYFLTNFSLVGQGSYEGARNGLVFNKIARDIKFKSLMKQFKIETYEDYKKLISEWIEGSQLSRDIGQLRQIQRIKRYNERIKTKRYSINGSVYSRKMLKELLRYEFNWPKNGIRTFEKCNAIFFLLCSDNFMKEEPDDEFVENTMKKISKSFELEYDSIKELCIDATMGRNIYLFVEAYKQGKYKYVRPKPIFRQVFYNSEY